MYYMIASINANDNKRRYELSTLPCTCTVWSLFIAMPVWWSINVSQPHTKVVIPFNPMLITVHILLYIKASNSSHGWNLGFSQ